MEKQKEFKIVGLTGEMGTGKSTVAKFLKKHKEIKIFDCDNIAQKATLENYQKIEKILGEKIFDNGKINNKKIASIIFNDLNKKRKIEKLIHPIVWQKIQREIEISKDKKVFIVESAIIYKIGWEKYFDGIILVTSKRRDQLKRIKNKSKLRDKQIKERLNQQKLNKRIERNNLIIIENNGSIKELEAKTGLIFEKIFALI